MKSRTCGPLLASTLAALALTGCVTTSFEAARSFEPQRVTPIDPAAVLVLHSPPAEPFTTLGEIEANITGYLTDEAILAKVRERAALVGANAVVHERDDYQTYWPPSSALDSNPPQPVLHGRRRRFLARFQVLVVPEVVAR